MSDALTGDALSVDALTFDVRTVDTTDVTDELDAVAVVAVGGSIGVRILARLEDSPDVGRIVEIDPLTAVAPDLGEALATLDVLVLLDVTDGADLDGADLDGADLDGVGGSAFDPETTRHLIETARNAGIHRIVYVSSAMAYGAWEDSPVPLTEDAPLRPVPELAYAVTKAEVERQLAVWRQQDPQARIAVLRPVVVLDPDKSRWITRSPWGRVGSLINPSESPRQFLHVDDLVEAVDTARKERLDGPFNVAPDGWLATDARRDLDGKIPHLPLPDRVFGVIGRARSWFGLSPVPEGLDPYLKYPWVVSNGRLEAAGWRPRHTNEEAYVDVVPQGRLAAMGVRRRQELSLAAMALGVFSVVTAAVLTLRWYGRRRSG